MPEVPFDTDAFLEKVKAIYTENNYCMVAVSEGIRHADGTFVAKAKISETDGFGHAQLGGTAARLAAAIHQKTGAKVRGIELSLLQRCAAHIASQTDIDEAFSAGKAAVEYALAGDTGKMVAFTRETVDGTYKCGLVSQPLSVCANMEKNVPGDWISEDGANVTQEFIDYVLPLIQGENKQIKENGLPRFSRLKKVKAEEIS